MFNGRQLKSNVGFLLYVIRRSRILNLCEIGLVKQTIPFSSVAQFESL